MTWNEFLAWLLEHEGRAITNDPRDPGRQTCWGISRRYHPRWPGWRLVDAGVVARSVLEPVVSDFYRDWLRDYWDALPPRLAPAVCDAVVNMGAGKTGDEDLGAIELLQLALNRLAGSDYVDVNGNRRHVIGYLKDFLFTPDRAQTPVSVLSGGERNRLLLARLFTRPCNVLVLDEPTNDLDQETLELLEELIGEFAGTVLVVSHDREFLNNTVTSCFVFEGGGRVVEYAGGYDDWLAQRPWPEEPEPVQPKAVKPKAPKARKLTWKENQELDALPGRIEALEAEIGDLQARMNDPEFYTNDHTVVAAEAARLEALESELDLLLARWDELEELRALCES